MQTCGIIRSSGHVLLIIVWWDQNTVSTLYAGTIVYSSILLCQLIRIFLFVFYLNREEFLSIFLSILCEDWGRGDRYLEIELL